MGLFNRKVKNVNPYTGQAYQQAQGEYDLRNQQLQQLLSRGPMGIGDATSQMTQTPQEAQIANQFAFNPSYGMLNAFMGSQQGPQGYGQQASQRGTAAYMQGLGAAGGLTDDARG
jgi:hypothetical protein